MPARDTTRALELANRLHEKVSGGSEEQAWTDELIHILQEMDARTGRRDQSKRKGRR